MYFSDAMISNARLSPEVWIPLMHLYELLFLAIFDYLLLELLPEVFTEIFCAWKLQRALK